MGWSDALYTDALALICPTRSWGLRVSRDDRDARSACPSRWARTTVFCFVPLTSVTKALGTWTSAKHRVAAVLDFSTATVDVWRQASDARWTLEEAPAGDGASALPCLKYALPRQLSASTGRRRGTLLRAASRAAEEQRAVEQGGRFELRTG